ncbi:MAG: DUF4307 domain-containing protein [Actinomycetota bacterium]|nr:DUF4307 domain-containing protein [Actinomycetota bacterium]
MTHPKVLASAHLRQRYGIKENNRNWLWPAVIPLLAGISWFIWSALNAANPDVRYELLSFKVVNDQSISVTYSISVQDLNTDHSCSIVARDIDKNTVGEISDLMPATSLKSGANTRTIEVATRLPAVNAGITSCQ